MMVMTKTPQTRENPFTGWTTIEEAADIIDRDRSVIRYWADIGKIECYPVGRKMSLVNIEEVKAYSATVKRKPGAGKRKS
jgi:hypothetical protein